MGRAYAAPSPRVRPVVRRRGRSRCAGAGGGPWPGSARSRRSATYRNSPLPERLVSGRIRWYWVSSVIRMSSIFSVMFSISIARSLARTTSVLPAAATVRSSSLPPPDRAQGHAAGVVHERDADGAVDVHDLLECGVHVGHGWSSVCAGMAGTAGTGATVNPRLAAGGRCCGRVAIGRTPGQRRRSTAPADLGRDLGPVGCGAASSARIFTRRRTQRRASRCTMARLALPGRDQGEQGVRARGVRGDVAAGRTRPPTPAARRG